MTPTIAAYTATSAAGAGKAEFLDALQAQRSGLRRNDFPDCELDTWIGRLPDIETMAFPTTLAHLDCRNNRVALAAWEHDGFAAAVRTAIKRHGAERVAIVMGTSTAGIGATEDAYRARDDDGDFPPRYLLPLVHQPHTSGEFVAQLSGAQGPCWTISTACSSSARVFTAARRLLASDLADAVIVGGADSLCLSVLYGFNSLELVSQAPCRPFSAGRDGLSLGEAGGYALLDRSDGDLRLLGDGEASDAHHMSAPHPEGAGAVAAMRQALARAGGEAGDIDYINLHGTATPMNDMTEGLAVSTVFEQAPACSSSKGWMGHTLGAAGIVEATVSLLAIEHGFLPANLGGDQHETALAQALVTTTAAQRVDRVLSNSFGFGGSNAALIFGRPA